MFVFLFPLLDVTHEQTTFTLPLLALRHAHARFVKANDVTGFVLRTPRLTLGSWERMDVDRMKQQSVRIKMNMTPLAITTTDNNDVMIKVLLLMISMCNPIPATKAENQKQ